MTSAFEIRLDDAQVQRLASQFTARARGAVRRAFGIGGQRMQRAMAERFRANDASVSAKGASSKVRDYLFRRTGSSADSFEYVVTEGEEGSDLRLVSFTAGQSHLRIQEKGGTIKPKRAKFLTIPLPDNLTPGGDTRYPSARDLFNRAEAGDGNAWIAKGVIFYTPAGSDKVLALFALRKQVTIPPRLGFERTMRALVPVIQGDAAEALRQEFGA